MYEAYHFGGPKNGEIIPLKYATKKVLVDVNDEMHEYLLIEKGRSHALYRYSKDNLDIPFTMEYRGFDINVIREDCLGGWSQLYYSIFRQCDGYELYSGFEDSEETILTKFEHLKMYVDDHINADNFDEDDAWLDAQISAHEKRMF